MSVSILDISKYDIRIIDSDGERSVDIINEVFSSGQLIDPLPLKYLVNKILTPLNTRDKLVISHSSDRNFIRTVENPGLKTEEIDNYIDLNLNSLVHINTEDFKISYTSDLETIYIFAMDRNFVDFVENITEKFKHVYLTTFVSQVLSFVKMNDIEYGIFVNVNKGFFEYVFIYDGEFKNHRYEDGDFNVDMSGYDLEKGENLSDNIKLLKPLMRAVDSYESLFSCGLYRIYSYGDRDMISVMKELSKDLSWVSFDPDVEGYFR